jgi:hypothetical protein
VVPSLRAFASAGFAEWLGALDSLRTFLFNDPAVPKPIQNLKRFAG